MNILITGGAGFIGSHLTETLYNLGHNVTILDSLSPQIHHDYYNSFLYQKVRDRSKLIIGDVKNIDDWKDAIIDQEVVIHLAAETGTGQSMYDIKNYYETNVSGTSNLLDLLTNSKHSVNKIILASSRALYGEGKYSDIDGKLYYPVSRNVSDLKKGKFELYNSKTGLELKMEKTDEESKLHPNSIYGLTKLNQEQMILLAPSFLNVSSISLRFQNVYGPGQSLNNPYTGLLAVFSNRIRNNKPLDIYEDGLESRDFVYIDDVVDSIVASIENNTIKADVMNIGSGVNTSVLEVARNLIGLYQSDSEIQISGNYRIGDIRHNCADISKASIQLNYKPNVDFKTGLSNFAKWVMSQKVAEDKYENSILELKSKGLMK